MKMYCTCITTYMSSYADRKLTKHSETGQIDGRLGWLFLLFGDVAALERFS